MLAAAARIASGVEVPVTVDAEAGYGMEPAELVAALRSAGAAGCNLEDTDHAAGGLRDPDRQAEWLGAVRRAASEDGYPLVINARVDVFFGPMLAGAGPGTQEELVPEALRRAHAYLEAGADCVYPIALWEPDALRRFISEVRGPVNVARLPQSPSLAELAALGVARVSWGPLLYRDAMARFADQLASLQDVTQARLTAKPSRQLAYRGRHPSSRLAFALEAPRCDISGAYGGAPSAATGGSAPQRPRKHRQPLGLRRRLVVDDVVDPGRAALERRDGRGRRVLDVEPAVHAGRALGERHAARDDVGRRGAVPVVRRAAAVDHAVAQHETVDPAVPVTRRSSSMTAATAPPNGGGALVNSGASSSLTRSPVGAYANAMLCATTRRAPMASAASMRFRVPSVRTRLFASNRLGLSQSNRAGNAVSWWMTTSGEASARAARTSSASNTSHTTGSAPTASSWAARNTDRVIAVTSCPASNSCGTSGLPITPVAPATKTRMPETVPERRVGSQ